MTPADKTRKVHWEQMSPEWWSASIGWVRMERNGNWSGYVLRNQRVGKGWTECKPGFTSKTRAMRWVEREGED